jgi:hypothetical protein
MTTEQMDDVDAIKAGFADAADQHAHLVSLQGVATPVVDDGPAPKESLVDRMKRELDEQLATLDERLRIAVARKDAAQQVVTALRAERETVTSARARLNGRKRKGQS